MAKITLEQIKEELAADGWLVLSSEYKNLDTEMTFECFEGHRVFAPWKKIRTKRECPVCKKNSLVKIESRKELSYSNTLKRVVSKLMQINDTYHRIALKFKSKRKKSGIWFFIFR